MKRLKTFETWNNDIIDNSLFSSGKAKYDPKVVGNKIRYSTGDTNPQYIANITQKGEKLICKIYKVNKKGKNKRLRNKVKSSLKLAHNYVREFLNQRIKKDEDKNSGGSKNKKSGDIDKYRDINKIIKQEIDHPSDSMDSVGMFSSPKPKNKTFIRRY